MIKITSCCGCFSLRGGVLVITFIHFMTSLSCLIAACVTLQDVALVIPLLVSLILSVAALIGTINEDVRLIFPFLSGYFTSVFVLLPYIFILMAQRAFKALAPGSTNVWICVGGMLSFGIGIFFLIIIYGFYQELLYKKFSSSNINSTVHP